MSNLRQEPLNWLTPELYPLDANTTNVNFISAGYKLYPVETHPCHGALEDDKAEGKKGIFPVDFGTGSCSDGEHGLPVEKRRDEAVEKDLPFSLPVPSYSLIRASSRGVTGKGGIRVSRRHQLLSARGRALGTELEKI